MHDFDGNYGWISIENTHPDAVRENIFVQKVGIGEQHVFLIPGNNCSGRVFDPILRYVTETPRLSHQYSLYTFDYRGSGYSSYNQPIAALSDFALDFEKVSMKIQGISKDNIVLVGYSMGVSVAMEMIMANPDRYSSLISLAGVGSRGLRAVFPASSPENRGKERGFVAGDWVPINDFSTGLSAMSEQQNMFLPGGRTAKNLAWSWENYVFNDFSKLAGDSAIGSGSRFRQHPDFRNIIQDAISVRYMPNSLYALHKFNASRVDIKNINSDKTKVIVKGDWRLSKKIKDKKVLLVKASTDIENMGGDLVIGDNIFRDTLDDFVQAGNRVTTILIPPGHGYDHGFPSTLPVNTVKLIDSFLQNTLDEKNTMNAIGIDLNGKEASLFHRY